MALILRGVVVVVELVVEVLTRLTWSGSRSWGFCTRTACPARPEPWRCPAPGGWRRPGASRWPAPLWMRKSSVRHTVALPPCRHPNPAGQPGSCFPTNNPLLWYLAKKTCQSCAFDYSHFPQHCMSPGKHCHRNNRFVVYLLGFHVDKVQRNSSMVKPYSFIRSCVPVPNSLFGKQI